MLVGVHFGLFLDLLLSSLLMHLYNNVYGIVKRFGGD